MNEEEGGKLGGTWAGEGLGAGPASWLRIRRSTVLRYTLIFILLFFFAVFFRRALTSVVVDMPEQEAYTVRSVRKSRRIALAAAATAPGTGTGTAEGKGDEPPSDKCR
jgi:hypothetical protein